MSSSSSFLGGEAGGGGKNPATDVRPFNPSRFLFHEKGTEVNICRTVQDGKLTLLQHGTRNSLLLPVEMRAVDGKSDSVDASGRGASISSSQQKTRVDLHMSVGKYINARHVILSQNGRPTLRIYNEDVDMKLLQRPRYAHPLNRGLSDNHITSMVKGQMAYLENYIPCAAVSSDVMMPIIRKELERDESLRDSSSYTSCLDVVSLRSGRFVCHAGGPRMNSVLFTPCQSDWTVEDERDRDGNNPSSRGTRISALANPSTSSVGSGEVSLAVGKSPVLTVPFHSQVHGVRCSQPTSFGGNAVLAVHARHQVDVHWLTEPAFSYDRSHGWASLESATPLVNSLIDTIWSDSPVLGTSIQRSLGEVAFVCQDGSLSTWRLEAQGEGKVEKRMYPLYSFSETFVPSSWMACDYTHHPRVIYVCKSDDLYSVDLRMPVRRAASPSMPGDGSGRSGVGKKMGKRVRHPFFDRVQDRVTAFATSKVNEFQYGMVVHGKSAGLFDSRFPSMPLLHWKMLPTTDEPYHRLRFHDDFMSVSNSEQRSTLLFHFDQVESDIEMLPSACLTRSSSHPFYTQLRHHNHYPYEPTESHPVPLIGVDVIRHSKSTGKSKYSLLQLTELGSVFETRISETEEDPTGHKDAHTAPTVSNSRGTSSLMPARSSSSSSPSSSSSKFHVGQSEIESAGPHVSGKRKRRPPLFQKDLSMLPVVSSSLYSSNDCPLVSVSSLPQIRHGITLNVARAYEFMSAPAQMELIYDDPNVDLVVRGLNRNMRQVLTLLESPTPLSSFIDWCAEEGDIFPSFRLRPPAAREVRDVVDFSSDKISSRFKVFHAWPRIRRPLLLALQRFLDIEPKNSYSSRSGKLERDEDPAFKLFAYRVRRGLRQNTFFKVDDEDENSKADSKARSRSKRGSSSSCRCVKRFFSGSALISSCDDPHWCLLLSHMLLTGSEQVAGGEFPTFQDPDHEEVVAAPTLVKDLSMDVDFLLSLSQPTGGASMSASQPDPELTQDAHLGDPSSSSSQPKPTGDVMTESKLDELLDGLCGEWQSWSDEMVRGHH